MDLENLNSIELSPRDAYEKSPVLTPDGRWVIYEIEGSAGLWKLSIDRGVPDQIVNDLAFRPTVDSNGERVAYWIWTGREGTSERGVSLGILSLSHGVQTRPPIKMPPSIDSEVNLQWSHDGKSIFHVDKGKGVSNIWSQSIGGGQPKQITRFKSGSMFFT